VLSVPAIKEFTHIDKKGKKCTGKRQVCHSSNLGKVNAIAFFLSQSGAMFLVPWLYQDH